MSRVLVVPAAGRGSRLGSTGPKALHPVAGRPMIDWVIDRHRPHADAVVVVVAPDAVPAMRSHLRSLSISCEIAIQPSPTGMLPAILCAEPFVRANAADEVWVSWCDQVGIGEETARRLGDELSAPDVSFALPLVRQSPPYIHFVQDGHGRIVDVLQRREGAAMPETGNSDTGLFGMQRGVFLEDLAAFAGLAPSGAATGERNFLPFIPWLAARKRVISFLIADAREARGVNTPEDLIEAERFLLSRR